MRKRVSLAIAVLIVLGLSLLILKFGKQLGLDDAFKMAGLTLGTVVKPLATWIEHLLSRRGDPESPDRLEQFDEPWWQLLAVGALALVGAVVLLNFVAGFAYHYAGGADDSLLSVIFLANCISVPIAACAIGFWMGGRAGWSGLGALIAVPVVGVVVLRSFDYLEVALTSDDPAFHDTRGFNSIESVLMALAMYLAFTVLAGVPAFWMGRRRRYGSYVYSLLRKYPPHEQREIAELVYERSTIRPPEAPQTVVALAAGSAPESATPA